VTSPWRIRLSHAAASDFEAISSWARDRFGEEQALVYRTALTATLALLGGGPSTPGVKVRSDIGRGIHTLHVSRIRRRARHIVMFRVAGEQQPEIIRILHDSMDLARHLPAEGP
jgi:toxin ParE1/3/4